MLDVAYGDGGITKRKDGRLQVAVVVDGRRLYAMVPKRLTGREARKRAEQLRAELVAKREAGLDPSGQTVEVFLRSWIEGLHDARNQRVRPRTLDHYRLVVERHLIPALGDRRLDRLSVRDVQRWLDSDAGAPRTVHHHRAVLRRALNVAVRQRLIDRNPAVPVELPAAPDSGGHPLTDDEANRILAVTADDRLHALWRLAIVTGLRQGELLGLARDDYAARTLTVRHQLQRRGGSWVFTPPKSARTLETLSLGPRTSVIVEAHLRRMAEERTPEWRYHGLMFVTSTGEPYHGSEVLKAWHRACDRAGVPRRRFHDLRHSNVTILTDLGVPEDVRMARVGHSTKRMSRRYGKASVAQDREAANRLDERLA